MANGNDAARHYQDAITAQMGERVTNLGRRVTDIESEMRSGFRQIETSISQLSATLAERAKPQWQAIGVALTFAVVIGGMAYWPIREATGDLKASMGRIEERMITRQEMEWRQARSQEDRLRMESSIATIRGEQVPRAELDRVWSSYDQRFSDHQRQIDEVKQAQNSVYGARDVLIDMRERLDRLEQQRRALAPPP
ncbi:hypothetical protein [Neoaquamicrobium sediminum]